MPRMGGGPGINPATGYTSNDDFYQASRSSAYPTFRPRPVPGASGESKYATRELEQADRPFADVGKVGLSLLGDANPQATPPPEPWKAQVGPVPLQGPQPGTMAAQVLGILGNIFSLPEQTSVATPRAAEFYNRLRDTPDSQLTLEERQIRNANQMAFQGPDSPVMQGKQMAEMYKAWRIAEAHARGESAIQEVDLEDTSMDPFTMGSPLSTIVDLGIRTWGAGMSLLTQVESQGIEMPVLGNRIGLLTTDQLEAVKKGTPEEIGEERTAIKEALEKGDINEQEARDMIAMSSMALSNPNPLGTGTPVHVAANAALAVGGEAARDPSTLIALFPTLGASLAAPSLRVTISSIERAIGSKAFAVARAAGSEVAEAEIRSTAINAAAKVAQEAAELTLGQRAGLRRLPAAGTTAAKQTGRVTPESVAPSDRLAEFVKMGADPAHPYAAEISEGIRNAGMAGHIAVKLPRIMHAAEAIDKMVDPLSLFGYWKTGKTVPLAAARLASHGAFDAYGWRVTRALDSALEEAGVDLDRATNSRYVSFANHTVQAGDASNTARRVATNSTLRDGLDPTQQAVRQAERSSGDIRRLVRDQVDRTLEFIVPGNRGGRASMMAQWQERAIQQMVHLGADPDRARAVVMSRMQGRKGERMMRSLANDHWGYRIDTLDGAKRTAASQANETWTPEKIGRVTFMGSRQMAQQDARAIAEAVAKKQWGRVRDAVRQFRDLNDFVSESLSDEELGAEVAHVLEQLDGHLPVRIEDFTDMPQALIDWRDQFPESHLMLGPGENDLLVPIRNRAGTLVGVKSWLDHVTTRTPTVEISRTKAIRETLFRGVTGSEIERAALRDFTGIMAGEEGLAREESEAIWNAVRNVAEIAERAPRALSSDQILRAVDEAVLPEARKVVARRAIRDAVVEAYEGQWDHVGVLPKTTGWIKTALTKRGGPLGENVRWLTDYVYPTLRFTKNVMFFWQEIPEAPFFLALQRRYPLINAVPDFALAAAGPLGARGRAWKERTALMNAKTEYVMGKMTQVSPHNAGDAYTAQEIVQLGLQTAANVTDPRTPLGRLLAKRGGVGRWTGLQTRKARNVAIAERAEFGEQVKRSLQQNSPEQWEAVRAFYPESMSDGEVAVQWSLDLMARGDPDSVYAAFGPQSFQPTHIGRQAEVSSRLVRYFAYGEDDWENHSWADLSRDIGDGTVSADQLRSELILRGADPNYVDRAVAQLGMNEDQFYQAAIDQGVDPAAVAAWRLADERAAAHNDIGLQEYLSRTWVGRALSVDQMGNPVGETLYDDVIQSMTKRGLPPPEEGSPDMEGMKGYARDHITGVFPTSGKVAGLPVPGYKITYEPRVNPLLEGSTDPDDVLHDIIVRDAKGNEVGRASLFKGVDDELHVQDVRVDPAHQRKGIANWMYREAEEQLGITLTPSQQMLPDGRALWDQPNRPFGAGAPEMSEAKKAAAKVRRWHKARADREDNPRLGMPPAREVPLPPGMAATLRGQGVAGALERVDAAGSIADELVGWNPEIEEGYRRAGVLTRPERAGQVVSERTTTHGGREAQNALLAYDDQGNLVGSLSYTTGPRPGILNVMTKTPGEGVATRMYDEAYRLEGEPFLNAIGQTKMTTSGKGFAKSWLGKQVVDAGVEYEPLYQTELHTIGRVTPEQYARQIETMMNPEAMKKRGMRVLTEKEVTEAIEWYSHMRRAMFALVDPKLTGDARIKEAARILISFGTTQLNTSPPDGFRHVFKAMGMRIRGETLQIGEARNILQQAVGLNPEQLHALVWNDSAKIGQMGIAQKLFDFIDSLTGSQTRTNGVLGPNGNWGPVAVDIHSKRDFGFLDPAMGSWVYNLVERETPEGLVRGTSSKFVKTGGSIRTVGGEEIDERKGYFIVQMSDGTTERIDGEFIGSGVPSDHEYDYGVELANDIRDHFNETGFMKRTWSSYEVQALGWYRMQLLKNPSLDAGEVANAIFEHSRWMGSHDLSPSTRAPMNEVHPWHVLERPEYVRSIQTEAILHAMDEAEGLSGVRVLTRRQSDSYVRGNRRESQVIEAMTDPTGAEQLLAHYLLLSQQDSGILMRDYVGKSATEGAPKYRQGVGISLDIPLESEQHGLDLMESLATGDGPLTKFGQHTFIAQATDGSFHLRTLWEPADLAKSSRNDFNKVRDASGIVEALQVDGITARDQLVDFISLKHDWKKDPTGGTYSKVIERGSGKYGVMRTPEQRAKVVSKQETAYRSAVRRRDALVQARTAHLRPAGEPLAEGEVLRLNRGGAMGVDIVDVPPEHAPRDILVHYDKGKPGMTVDPANTPRDNVVVFRDKDGQPVGYIRMDKGADAVDTTPGKVSSIHVFVKSDARRQGVATKLYDWAERQGWDFAGTSGKTVTAEGRAFTGSRMATAIKKANKAVATAKKEMERARAAPGGRPVEDVQELVRAADLRVRGTVEDGFNRYAAREVRHERERVLGEARDAAGGTLGTDPTVDAVLDLPGATASNGERLYERTPGGTVRAAVQRRIATDRRTQLYLNKGHLTDKSLLHELIHVGMWDLDDSAVRSIKGVFAGMEGTPFGKYVPGTPLSEAEHEWLVDQFFLWVENPDSVHPILSPLMNHFRGKLGTTRTLKTRGTAPAREAIKRYDADIAALKVQRASATSTRTQNRLDREIAQAQAHRDAAAFELKGLQATGGLHPEVQRVFDDIAAKAGERTDTRASTYNADEQDMLEWAQIAARSAQRRANDLVHMRGSRSAFERSINHPFLFLYPTSYMYGKVLPYLAEFLMFRPFGFKAPFAALSVGNHMNQSFQRQQQYDPELRNFLYKNEPFLRAMSMFVPGVPWDMPAGLPIWMRRAMEAWMTNEVREQRGQKPKDVDIPGLIADMAQYQLSLRGTDSLENIAGAAQHTPDILGAMLTGEAPTPQAPQPLQP